MIYDTFNGNAQREPRNIQQSIEAKELMLLMALMDSKEVASEHIWFLDFSCSNHMRGNKDMFCDLDNSFKESVKLGDDSGLIVQGKGMV
jgi:hypothetical protein